MVGQKKEDTPKMPPRMIEDEPEGLVIDSSAGEGELIDFSVDDEEGEDKIPAAVAKG
jgi:hypothetical protein